MKITSFQVVVSGRDSWHKVPCGFLDVTRGSEGPSDREVALCRSLSSCFNGCRGKVWRLGCEPISLHEIVAHNFGPFAAAFVLGLLVCPCTSLERRE